MFGCQREITVVPLAMRKSGKHFVKVIDSPCGLSIQLGLRDVGFLGRKDRQEKKFIRDKNFNVDKPLHFKNKHQIQNVAALRFSSFSKIQIQPSSNF